jgi:hypothetical protein
MEQVLTREQGKALLLALYTQDQWVIRTVDRVNFIDRNTARRRIVRHFSLPRHTEARAEIDGRCLLPVFTLRKGTFISCDLRDAGDRRVALRPIEERWDLTASALEALVEEAQPGATNDEDLVKRIRRLVRCTFAESDDALESLLEYREDIEASSPQVAGLLATKAFRKLATHLSKNYLVFADIPMEDGEAHMISYLIDQRFLDRVQDFREAGMPVPRRAGRLKRLLGLAPHVYLHLWPITGAGSSHLEIEAPEGVDFGYRDLRLPRRRTIRHPGTSARHARFLAPRTAAAGEGYVRLNVHPGSGVMRTAGPAVGLFFAALVAVVAISDATPSGAATLLLILPGLTSYVAARPGEHPYVTRVVRGVRYLTLSPVPLSALAAAILVAGWPSAYLWLVAGLPAAAASVLAFGARRLKVRPAYIELGMSDLTRIA